MASYLLTRTSHYLHRFGPRYDAYYAFLQHTNADLDEARSEGVGSKKRTAEFEPEQPQVEAKRRRRFTGHPPRESHDKRLTGDYDAGKNPVPIGIPQGEDEMAATDSVRAKSASAAGVLSRPKGRGGVRPTNTLDARPHDVKYAQPSRPSGSMSYDQGTTASKRASAYSTSQSKGRDGFDDHEVEDRRHNKRLKLDRVPPLPAQPTEAAENIAIDLTSNGDGSQEIVGTTITKMNGKPVRNESRLSQRAIDLSSPSKPFEHREFKNVDSKVRVGEKSKRKSKEGRPSDQGSSRGTPVTSHGSPRMATSLYSDDNEDVHVIPNPREPKKPKTELQANGQKAKAALEINLTKGFRDHPPKAKKAGEMDDVAEINRRMIAHQKQPWGPPPSHAEANPAQRPPRRTIRQETTPQRDNTSRRSTHPPEETGTDRLNDKFQRVNATASPKQSFRETEELPSRAGKNFPKPSTRASPISDESPDPLANGDNTVSRKGLSSIRKPEKRPGREAQIATATHGIDEEDRRAGSAWAAAKAKKKSQPAQQEERSHDDERISISAFYAATCILESGDIGLRYSPEEKLIYLTHNAQMVQIPGKGRVLSISDQEVNKVLWDRHHDDLAMCTRGPAGDVIGGWMCIVFNSTEDTRWFHDCLLAVTNERLLGQPMDTDKFRVLFQKYRENINHGYQQAARKRELAIETARRETMTQARQTQSARDRPRTGQFTYGSQRSSRTRSQAVRQGFHDDEQIQYEVEESPSRTLSEEITSRRDSDRRRDTRSEGLHRSEYFTPATPRRSGRASTSTRKARSPTPPQKWTRLNNLAPWPHPVVYPTEGPKRVTVDFQDLERLDEDEFLNDNIVGFAMRQIEEAMSPGLRESVFFFNTFFYTALSTKDGKKAFNYDAVKRWTKKTDLMGVPFVVVPINLHLHWFLAIICNLPNIDRKSSTLDDEDAGDDEDLEAGSDYEQFAAGDANQTAKANLSQSTDAMEHLNLSEPNNGTPRLPSDAEEVADKPSSKGRKSKKKKAPPQRQYEANVPIIITLDSLGSQHTVESRFLKDYIVAEAFEKRGMAVIRDEIQGMTAKGIPQQVNFSDCGVYVVGYLEQFAKDPRGFVKSVLSREINKEADFASFDPSAKREQIRNDLLQMQKEQQEARQGVKKPAKKATTKATEVPDQPSKVPPATAAPDEQGEVQAPKEVTKKVIREAVAIEPTPPPLPVPGPGNQSVDCNQSQDEELDTGLPRPLDQRESEQSEEILEPDSSTIALQRELLQQIHAPAKIQHPAAVSAPAEVSPPAEIPDSQEEVKAAG